MIINLTETKIYQRIKPNNIYYPFCFIFWISYLLFHFLIFVTVIPWITLLLASRRNIKLYSSECLNFVFLPSVLNVNGVCHFIFREWVKVKVGEDGGYRHLCTDDISTINKTVKYECVNKNGIREKIRKDQKRSD